VIFKSSISVVDPADRDWIMNALGLVVSPTAYGKLQPTQNNAARRILVNFIGWDFLIKAENWAGEKWSWKKKAC